MAERSGRAQRSRQAILDAAARLFAERGYAGTSVDAIVRAAGITKGGLYFHFSSKRALALAVIAENQRRWQARALEEAQRHPRAVDRLFAMPRALARMAEDGQGPAALRALLDELGRDPEVRHEAYGTLGMAVRVVADQFREAQAEGSIRPDVDPDLLAELAVGGFVGMQTLTEQLGDGELQRRVEALIRVVQLATLSGS